jgi:ATP-dependent Clp protease ATP-binding subunit ClpB
LASNDIGSEYTEKAAHYQSEKGYDPQYGARPIKRLIQKEVLNHLAQASFRKKSKKARPSFSMQKLLAIFRNP